MQTDEIIRNTCMLLAKPCSKCVSTLCLELYTMFPHGNSVILPVVNTYSLKRFISCYSDSTEQTVYIIVNKRTLWEHHGLNVFVR